VSNQCLFEHCEPFRVCQFFFLSFVLFLPWSVSSPFHPPLFSFFPLNLPCSLSVWGSRTTAWQQPPHWFTLQQTHGHRSVCTPPKTEFSGFTMRTCDRTYKKFSSVRGPSAASSTVIETDDRWHTVFYWTQHWNNDQKVPIAVVTQFKNRQRSGIRIPHSAYRLMTYYTNH
jgi:hypothetical protein